MPYVSSRPGRLAITQTIIGLGHPLGLHVVAEGVDHEAEATVQREAGCDELQDSLFARPMPAAAVADWLQGRILAASVLPKRSPLPRRTSVPRREALPLDA